LPPRPTPFPYTTLFRSLQRLAALEHRGEGDIHLASPLGSSPLLLVHRRAFGEPPRQALIRHLQRDDVRQLVPERRFPLKFARRADRKSTRLNSSHVSIS